MTTLWLHIGAPATGAAPLKAFLADNAATLAAEGVAVLGGLEAAASAGADLAVFSDADLFALDPADVLTRVPAAARAAAKVVLYVRRQDRFLEALYKDAVCAGRTDEPFEAFAAARRGACDWAARVEAWEAAIGAARVEVRRFDKGALVKGDVRRDFLALLGRRVDKRFDMNQAAEPAPNAWLTHALAELAAVPGAPVAEVARAVLDAQPSFRERRADLFAPDARGALLDSFAGSNERLRAARFADKPALFDESDLKNLKPAPNMSDDVRAALRDAYAALDGQLRRIARREARA